MKFLIISFVLAVPFVGISNAQANQTCIHTGLITPVQKFTRDRVLGTWYAYKVYAGLAENSNPLQYRCLEVNISTRFNDVIPLIGVARFIDFSNGTDVPKKDSAFMAPLDRTPASWKVITVPEPGGILEIDSVFVQTDYDNWALEFSCAVKNNYRYENMAIWTRTRNPDPEVMAILEIFVKNYGFSPENEMPVKQSNC